MLAKKLGNLVRGSSLAPLTDADSEQFEKMADEVQACKPTAIDKRIALGLVWPFGRSGQPGGIMNMQLEVTDFPGEYASPDAKPDDRDRLASHLRRVDGLLLVIDPTDLEADLKESNDNTAELDFPKRIAFQRKAIESMFREDRLDMGRSFRRAIAIVVTKRDALTPELLTRIAAQGSQESEGQLKEMQSLAAQKQLTVEESHRLGYWVLLCLCPTLRDQLETMLRLPTAVFATRDGEMAGGWKRQWCRFRNWLVSPTRPQLQIFCISQMGLALGNQVVEHRRRIQEWKQNGSNGNQPTIRLDLDGAPTDGMDLHYPFRWLFDQIPNGWLHECAGLSFGRREVARWFGPYRRFPGAPAVQKAIGVSWRRGGTAIVLAIMVFFAFAPIFRGFDAHLERQFVSNLLEKDAAGPATTTTLRQLMAEAHRKSTKPYPSALATFETLLTHHDELDGFTKLVNDEKQDLKFRIEQAAEWLQLQHQLPEGDTTEDQRLLLNYRTRLREPAADMLRRLKEQCVNLTDDSKRPSEGDWKLIHEQRKLTDQDGLCHSESGESVRKSVFEKLTDLCVEREQEQLSDKIDKLLKPETPDYPAALLLIDGPAGAKLGDLGDQGRKAHDDLRKSTVLRFWSHTETEVKLAIDRADINRMRTLYRDFNLLAGVANQFAELARKQEANAFQTVVEVRVNKAKQEPDAAQKWQWLSEVENHVKSANPDLQNQWREVAAEAKQELKEWLPAFRFLSELGDDTRRKSKQEDLWRDWFKFLKQEVPQLLENQKVDEAKGLIVDFQNSRPPKDLLGQCDELAGRIPSVELQATLNQVAENEAKNPEKALELLRNAIVNIDRNRDAVVLKQWRRKTVDLFQRLDKHPDADHFLEDLRLKKLAPLPHESELVDELWRDYVAQSISQFDKLVDDPSHAADAWRKLRGRATDERVPTSARKALQNYAEGEVQKRLPSPRQNSDPKAISTDRKTFDALKQDIEPWHQGKVIADLLQLAETTLIDAEFTNELSNLVEESKNSGLSRDVHKELHSKFQPLLTKNSLSPGQKAKAEVESRKHLANWEQDDFLKLYNAHRTNDFIALSDNCDNYLNISNNPYIRPDQSDNEVKAIKVWLDQFKTNVAYNITGIKLIGLPYYEIRSRFDPAVEVRNSVTGGTINAQKNNQHGTVTLPIGSASTLNWKLGDPLEIGIWDDAIHYKGYCIGVVQFAGDYSLLKAISQPTKVLHLEHDFKAYNFHGLQVQLEVSDPSKFRPPPLTERK